MDYRLGLRMHGHVFHATRSAETSSERALQEKRLRQDRMSFARKRAGSENPVENMNGQKQAWKSGGAFSDSFRACFESGIAAIGQLGAVLGLE